MRLEGLRQLLLRQRSEEAEQPVQGVVREPGEDREAPRQLGRLRPGHERDGAIEEAHETFEFRQPFAQLGQFAVRRRAGGHPVGLADGVGDERQERVRLAQLALLGDALEPDPVVADLGVGDRAGATPADAPGVGHALHEAPGLAFGQGQAGGPVAQPEGFADLALGEGACVGQDVAVDAGHGRRHAPGRPHLAPRLGEVAADLLGDAPAMSVRRRARGRGPLLASGAGRRCGHRLPR